MADNNLLSKEEQQGISNLILAIDKNLLKQNWLLERINIYLLILTIAASLGFLFYVFLHIFGR